MKNILKAVGIVTILATCLPTWADTVQAQGQVRRIKSDQHEIAIKQEAISSFDLPAMTLVYQIDPTLLVNIKAGDMVVFKAEKKDNEYFILEIKLKN